MPLFWLKHRGTTFPVPTGECVIGRSPSAASIVLVGERVSRQHAMLKIVDGQLMLEDLGSRNGTYVNGRRVAKPTMLRAGDVIAVGEEVLEVSTKAATAARSDWDEDEEDVATVTERNAVGLVEELVARAAETGQRAAIAPSVREMIDAIVHATDQTGRPLARKEAVKLLAVARVVAGWVADRSLDAWCDELARRLHA
jgi:pSer/pThr/pTyr-binding forkhead associated (FHA) protein